MGAPMGAPPIGDEGGADPNDSCGVGGGVGAAGGGAAGGGAAGGGGGAGGVELSGSRSNDPDGVGGGSLIPTP